MNYDDWKATDPAAQDYCPHGFYHGRNCPDCEGHESEETMSLPEKLYVHGNWCVDKVNGGEWLDVCTDVGPCRVLVCAVRQCREDADEIVRRYNAYPKAIEALRALLWEITEEGDPIHNGTDEALRMAREALREGGEG